MADSPTDGTAQVAAPEVAMTHAEESSITQPDNAETLVLEQDLQDELPSDVDEETRIKLLTTGARAQDELERDIGRQADQFLTEQADERDKKRIEKTEAEAKRAEGAIQRLRNRLALPTTDTQKAKIRGEIATYQKKIEELDADMDAIQQRINDRHKDPEEAGAEEGVNGPLPNESRSEFLIRTGKITPFSKLAQTSLGSGSLSETLLDAELEGLVEQNAQGPVSHRNLMKPGFEDSGSSSEAPSPEQTSRSQKRRRITPASDSESSVAPVTSDADSDAFDPGLTDRQLATLDESDAQTPVTMSEDDEFMPDTAGHESKSRGKKRKATTLDTYVSEEDLAGVDDGNEKLYQKRVQKWSKARAAARRRANEKQGEIVPEDEGEEECFMPHPTKPDTVIDGGFRVPGDIFPALFDYQKTGVQWLWELYQQNVGGIVGDEMGLGKTVQVIAFIAGLHYSKRLKKPAIVVCPGTVMTQWVNEFHRWWPALRVSILHASGSGMLNTRREDRLEREMELKSYGDYDSTLTGTGKAAKKIVEKVKRHGHVLITTYSGLQTYSEFLLSTEWECAILDEGHKIRNPNTAITIHCKELRTPNRIILSGTPIQNNLTELWSLFDFVFPMRLGTLVSFRNTFEFPIKRGGFSNASNLEFETAARCAATLKEAIKPYLIQRVKADVAADLPHKTEQVLFCKLTRQQREAYEAFITSDEMKSIADGKRQMLYGIDYLRKICNHPDLIEHKNQSKQADDDYGSARKSGKMLVLKEMLSLWRKSGHKALLFCQHRIMLDILQRYLDRIPGTNYLRMDGKTPMKDRQGLVDKFNNDPDVHVFLLTTKVGGLGLNLTGADRVIIYDPDWNPSTDSQARERAYRLGQQNNVEIYRFLTPGTIEEKIYHRQIFKSFLANKVLKDPTQRQTFQLSELQEFFTLDSETNTSTETGELFRGSEVSFDKHGGEKPETSVPNATTATELAAIKGISHAAAFRDSSSKSSEAAAPSNEPSAESKETTADSRLMSSIFARSGIHSVVEHDAIMSSTTGGRKRKVQADPRSIEREAKRQAAIAAEQLKKSLEEARNVPAGVPTWTGEFGEAGRPIERAGSSSRGGRGGRGGGRGGTAPSSSSVLSSLAARQGRPNPTSTATNSSGSSGSSRVTGAEALRANRMIENIRNYMMTQGGTVPSQMLIDHFDHWCRAQRGRIELFKEMLAKIATLERPGHGRRGRWVLRDEYRTDRGQGARPRAR